MVMFAMYLFSLAPIPFFVIWKSRWNRRVRELSYARLCAMMPHFYI